jgi:endonuclease/exonuclease/phosphatase family metal-dependent hydrolase
MGTRKAAGVYWLDKDSGIPCDFIGVHLDDRLAETRREQALNLLVHRIKSDQPTIIAGDFNDMHRRSPRAAVARTLGRLGSKIPAIEPQEYHELQGIRKKLAKPQRFGSLVARLGGMAEGRAVTMLEVNGFYDADSSHQPTMLLANRPLFQLDRAMVNRRFDIPEPGVTVHVNDGLSDHLGISVPLRAVQ